MSEACESGTGVVPDIEAGLNEAVAALPDEGFGAEACRGRHRPPRGPPRPALRRGPMTCWKVCDQLHARILAGLAAGLHGLRNPRKNGRFLVETEACG